MTCHLWSPNWKSYFRSQLITNWLFHLRLSQTHTDWHLIPGSAFEGAPGSLLPRSAPLLEEKRDPGSQALISDLRDPFLQDRPCARTRLAVPNALLCVGPIFGCIICTTEASDGIIRNHQRYHRD